MFQRIIIARALAQEPKILLLDEPTVHLDISHQIEILDLIKKLNKENNFTVISVFHDLNLAAQYCKRLRLIHNGNIFSTGSPRQVLTAENIKETYNIDVLVKNHPLNLTIYVAPIIH